MGEVVKHMLLTIDVGNTHTVLGTWHDDELTYRWRVRTDASQTADQARIMLNSLFALDGIVPRDVEGVILATVVPALNRLWSKVALDLCGRKALSIDSEMVGDLLDLSTYKGRIGADRIADAVAARAHYGDPVIVVDLGTATNIEVIDTQGRFCGGVIAPGVETSLNALISHTVLLPAIEMTDPGTAIGSSTVQAIQVGMMYGEVDRIDGLIRRIWKQLGYQTAVVATGGFGRAIATLTQTVTAVDPDLTLRGLHAIYKAVSPLE